MPGPVELVGPVEGVEVIASGTGIRELARLKRLFGAGNWRKLKSRSNDSWIDAMKTKFVLCIDDGGSPESLERRKFYQALDDADAAREGMIRVIDESGEDYLYPQAYFVEVSLPPTVERSLQAA